MTPQEIHDYKLSWLGSSYSVTVNEDLDISGKRWCRDNLERHQWSFSKYTDIYEHTFMFEHENDAKRFNDEFLK